MNAAFLCTLAAVAGCCWADYTFFQTYHSYLNPEHSRGDTGQCCDSQDMPPCPEFSSCDNIFTLCVQSTGQPLPPAGIIQPQDCPLGYGVTDIFPNSDNITFDASMPVASTGDIWLGSFRLVVQVYDADSGNPDDFVDVLVVESLLSPSPSFTPPTTYTSTSSIFTLVLSFRVECSDKFYGEKCDVFCEPGDEQGQCHCNSEGEKMCLAGNQPPNSNCTECGPAMNCTANCTGNCTESRSCAKGSGDDRVKAIVAGVVVSVVVIVTVGTVVLVLAIVVNRRDMISWRSTKGLIPGDNPIYMSSADMNGVSSSALHSPTHSSASPPSRATDTTPIDDLVIEEQGEEGESGEMGEEGEVVFDDIMSPHSTSHGKLDPYGNYGDKTITRVAGVAPPPQLFDDSKYAEWSPPSMADNDDVNSDCQSEYL